MIFICEQLGDTNKVKDKYPHLTLFRVFSFQMDIVSPNPSRYSLQYCKAYDVFKPLQYGKESKTSMASHIYTGCHLIFKLLSVGLIHSHLTQTVTHTYAHALRRFVLSVNGGRWHVAWAHREVEGREGLGYLYRFKAGSCVEEKIFTRAKFAC